VAQTNNWVKSIERKCCRFQFFSNLATSKNFGCYGTVDKALTENLVSQGLSLQRLMKKLIIVIFKLIRTISNCVKLRNWIFSHTHTNVVLVLLVIARFEKKYFTF